MVFSLLEETLDDRSPSVESTVNDEPRLRRLLHESRDRRQHVVVSKLAPDGISGQDAGEGRLMDWQNIGDVVFLCRASPGKWQHACAFSLFWVRATAVDIVAYTLKQLWLVVVGHNGLEKEDIISQGLPKTSAAAGRAYDLAALLHAEDARKGRSCTTESRIARRSHIETR